ncbi:MAG TPA: Uma2 family endonuclease [Phototrophicaceae bacterium]|jgi:Uma2 family endonuclease|nr:Uma2 family endonuclease [Phototrophicaceae bacterium]
MTEQEQPKIRYTIADLERIAALPENLNKQFELLDGKLYEIMPEITLYAFIIKRFQRFIDEFVKEYLLGYVFSDRCSYAFADDQVLVPDCSFVSKNKGIQPPFPDKFPFAPDLAIEVVSPSNRSRELMNKIQNYLKYSTRLVWVVYLDDQVIEGYRTAAEGFNVRTFNIHASLDGEDVLPGFKLEVWLVFPV